MPFCATEPVGDAVEPAPPSRSQNSIRLLSLPFAPVVVEKTMTPEVDDANVDLSVIYLRELPIASLMNLTAVPPVAVLVLAIVSCFAVPTPPGRPSKMTFEAPFRFKVAVVLALVIERFVAPACGLIVKVLELLAPMIEPKVSG